MALSVRSGIVDIDLIGTNFEFFTTTPAIILLGIAMPAEFAAYYVPFIDNLLDNYRYSGSSNRGVGMTAISLEERASNSVAIAIVVGGGMSATIQTATVAARGIAQPSLLELLTPVATSENIASVALTIIALLFPFWRFSLHWSHYSSSGEI